MGDNRLIMAYSHVAHDRIIGNNCIMSNNAQMAGHVIMGDYAILAGMCAIHQFVQIGQHAFVAGGSLVSKDVPPFIKAGRTPLSHAGVNSVGPQRRGFSHERINQVLDIYRIIYNKNMNISQALNYIEEELPASDERDDIVTFIRESGRVSSSASAKEAWTTNNPLLQEITGRITRKGNLAGMQISLHDMGKRYNWEWIFRHVSPQFAPRHSLCHHRPKRIGKINTAASHRRRHPT